MIVKPKVHAWNKSSNNAATNKNQPKLTSYVIKHKNGFSPLYAAVKRGYAKAAKRSIENKLAKVRGEDAFFTLLCKVAARNILDVVKHLTKNGMGIEITDQDGFTPLHIVAVRNSAKSIKYLLENGANLEARDNSGCTPLHCAVMSNCIEEVKCLVERGANLEAQDKDGCAPLHCAVISGCVKGVKCLVESGANLEARNNKGHTPLFYAQHRHNDKIIKLLQKKTKSKKDLDRDVLKETKSQHSQTSEVSLKKVEKKPPLSKIAYVSLVTTSMVGSILSIVSGLFVLSMITTSVTSALVAGGITYTMSKPATELKGVAIEGLVQHSVGKV